MQGSYSCKTHQIEENTIQPLISAVTSAAPHSSCTPPTPSSKTKCCGIFLTCFKNHRICFRSGAAILILLWNIIVGAIYGSLQCAVIAVALSLNKNHHKMKPFRIIQVIAAGLATIAIMQILLFPFGGLLADIWYGRYRIIHFSFIKITLGFIFLSIAGILSYLHAKEAHIIFLSLCILLLSLGFAGFQSNAVQFGLDQLQDAPSQELSLFLHWYVWTSNLGEMIARIIGSLLACNSSRANYIYFIPIFFVIFCLLLLVTGCCKHHWFQCEPRSQNPYGTVVRVLQFVAKNKYPLHRSARTYCGDMTPSRMDYANTLFGGPFSVEVVEDVKTFLRMLVMLILICPVFYYNIPISSLYPLYALHVGRNISNKCTVDWLLLQSGNLAYITTFLAIPFYILFIFPKITKVAPRILHRMLIGIFLLMTSVAVMCMLFAAAIGHYQRSEDHQSNCTKCLFFANFKTHHSSPTLNLNALTFIIPNLLTGIALPLISIAVLEFTSAQSPYPMKGLLLGAFYAVRGMYILIGCLIAYIFTTHPFEETHSFWDCGFIYYLFNAFLGFVCLYVAVKASKWYQYRLRQEKPYDHRYVEEYYSRYASKCTGSIDESTEESHHNYGTLVPHGSRSESEFER